MSCPHCPAEPGETCPQCGASAHPASTGEPAAPAEDERLADYKACIGPRQQAYYLEQFARFDARGKPGLSWHWPACFMTFLWMLYRKMWSQAFVYLLIATGAFVGVGILGATLDSESVSLRSGFATLLILMLIPALWANALYYQHCKKQIAAARASSRRAGAPASAAIQTLAIQGGTSLKAGLPVGLPILFVALVGGSIALYLPTIKQRDRTIAAIDAYVFGFLATQAVLEYRATHQHFPPTLEAAGFDDPLPEGIRPLEFDPEKGMIRLTFASGNVAGKGFQMMVSQNETQEIFWTCVSDEELKPYLPQHCKNPEPRPYHPSSP